MATNNIKDVSFEAYIAHADDGWRGRFYATREGAWGDAVEKYGPAIASNKAIGEAPQPGDSVRITGFSGKTTIVKTADGHFREEAESLTISLSKVACYREGGDEPKKDSDDARGGPESPAMRVNWEQGSTGKSPETSGDFHVENGFMPGPEHEITGVSASPDGNGIRIHWGERA